MLVVSWARVFSLILPGLIETFNLSLDQAGLCVTALETGGFLAMLVLSFAMDRWGAIRLLSSCLLVGSVALFLSTVAPSYEILLLVFFFLGAGTASTASAVNALMAATGERRGFYLGVVHSAFGLFSIAAPLVAGVLIVYSGWQAYYVLVGLIGLIVAMFFHRATRPVRAAWRPPSVIVSASGSFATLRRIGLICVGVSTLVGVQSVFNSWSYLYSLDRFGVERGIATLAPACIWSGILLGRAGHTFLSRQFSARFLLLGSCLLAASATQGVYLAPFFWVAAVAFVGVGMGVGGAYQLGTAWAAERAPQRVGTASTFIMASAALGAGIWPWVTGVVIEAGGFQDLTWVVFGVLGLGTVAFYVSKKPS
jgi:MFS family permease